MKIFIDTEFTDFIECDLISIGFASDDSRQFYGERNDFSLAGCSDFVRKSVLPQLGKKPECVYSKGGLRAAVHAWLNQFSAAGATICYDFVGDIGLLHDLIGDFPPWLKTRNVSAKIDDLQFEYFIGTLFDGAQHHALNDAICNKLAYKSEK